MLRTLARLYSLQTSVSNIPASLASLVNGHVRVGSEVFFSEFCCCKFSTKNTTIIMPATENSPPVLKYVKMSPNGFAPVKSSLRSAGYDLRSAVELVIPANGKALIRTDIKVELPVGCYGRIAPRSGLAMNNFIDVGAGVVDEDYRGMILVILFNHSPIDFKVKKGDRIAQLICEQIFYPELQEVKELSETIRGDDGFGSSGIM